MSADHWFNPTGLKPLVLCELVDGGSRASLENGCVIVRIVTWGHSPLAILNASVGPVISSNTFVLMPDSSGLNAPSLSTDTYSLFVAHMRKLFGEIGSSR